MRQIPNNYTQYELTAEEEKSASIFNIYQEAKLRNLLVRAMDMKLGLKVNTTNVNDFIQQEAYYTGQIDLLAMLIDESITASKSTGE